MRPFEDSCCIAEHIPWRLKAGKFGDGIALESEESGSPSSTCLGLDDDDDDDDVIVIGSTPAPIIPDGNVHISERGRCRQ